MSGQYIGPSYEQNGLVKNFHAVPRFGRTSDIAMLTSPEANQPEEYTIGSLFIMFVLVSVFVVCAVTIFALNCVGPRIVGFWAGDGFREPKKFTMMPYRRPRRVRITFIVCAIAVITSTILMILFALPSIENAARAIDDSAMNISSGATEGLLIANSLSEIGISAEEIRDDLVIGLSTFCPDLNISESLGGIIDPVDISTTLDSLNDFLLDELEVVKENLDNARQVSDQTANAMQSYAAFKYKPLYYVPVIVFSVMLIGGTAMAWRQGSPHYMRCFQSYLLLPLFTLWMILSWMLACATAVVVVMNADTCSGGEDPGSPSGTVTSILDLNGVDPESLVYRATVHYSEGCVSENPFSFMESYRQQLSSALTMSQPFVFAVERVGATNLSQLCGSDVGQTVDALKALQANIVALLELMDRTIELVACERVNPVFVQAFHDAGCGHSMEGLVWMLATLIVISVCGMIMVALRAALLHVRYRDPTELPESPARGAGKGRVAFYGAHPDEENVRSDRMQQMRSSSSRMSRPRTQSRSFEDFGHSPQFMNRKAEAGDFDEQLEQVPPRQETFNMHDALHHEEVAEGPSPFGEVSREYSASFSSMEDQSPAVQADSLRATGIPSRPVIEPLVQCTSSIEEKEAPPVGEAMSEDFYSEAEARDVGDATSLIGEEDNDRFVENDEEDSGLRSASEPLNIGNDSQREKDDNTQTSIIHQLLSKSLEASTPTSDKDFESAHSQSWDEELPSMSNSVVLPSVSQDAAIVRNDLLRD